MRIPATSLVCAMAWLAGSGAGRADSTTLNLSLRQQSPVSPGGAEYQTEFQAETWDPKRTAIIVCDVWDLHHCRNAVRRVEEFAPRLNEVVKSMRARGATVIHAPSDCMAAYEMHPARLRVTAIPVSSQLPDDIEAWCNRIPAEEQAVYPIDQSDGGEDDDPAEHAEWARTLEGMGRNPGSPWKQQSDLIEIDPARDYVSDKGNEVWSVLETRGIENVILAGVHTNMCVLGRPFGLRQMAKNGKHVVLLRDMTDTMYNPAMWPYVSHFTGTDRIIRHIERHVCPTITSDQIIGGRPFRFAGDQRPHVVLLMSEEEYETAHTLTAFAEKQLGRNFRVSCVYGRAADGNDLVGLDALHDADLAIVSVRRRTPPAEQMEIVRRYFAAGKPAIGIRTASHAFSLREGSPPAGHVEWREFDAEVWGGHYTGHAANDLTALIAPSAGIEHAILADIPREPFPSAGSLYFTSPLAPGAVLLATGRVEGQDAEPVAWTFNRADGGRSFYTSLGARDDFDNARFVRMLLNATHWALHIPPPTDERVSADDGDFHRRWTPVAFGRPVAGRVAEALQCDGAVWFRCGLRWPVAMRQHADPLAITLPDADYHVWMNGTRRPSCIGPRLFAGIEAADLNGSDSDFIVVRAANVADARRLVENGVGLSALFAAAEAPREVASFLGVWELRCGDDPSWAQPALPAKFALPPAVHFEVTSDH